MRNLFYMLFATVAILTAATACDDNNIGQSTIESESHLIVDSSFVLEGTSVRTERIQSRTLTQLLGVIQTNEYGTLRSDFVTEFMPSSVLDTVGVSTSDIDSIDIMFKVPIGAYTGDSITPMKVNVYRLNKNLPYPIYSDFNPKDYYNESDLLGSKSYSMTTLNRDSALYYQLDSEGNTQVFQMIVVGLPRTLGTDLFAKYKSDPEIFKDPVAFSKFFPGIYATTSFGNGRVVRVAETTMNLYYTKHTKTEEGKDSTYQLAKSYFGVSSEIVTNNNISMTPSESIEEQTNSGKIVITSPTGYEARLKFPTTNILEKFRTLAKEGQTVLNEVTLKIPVQVIENDKHIDPPQYLLLIRDPEGNGSMKDTFFKDNKLPDNVESFYAEYDSDTQSYTFTGIRAYLKEIIDGEISESENIEDFLLMPVDIEFESTTDNSYYYYYGIESESTPKKIAPQVSRPTMVAFDPAKAKIIVTYSKKDFIK